jgi:Zn finger protein HypA/HybF involved in hydrogenase expression
LSGLCEGTIAEGSELSFRRIPAELACDECNLSYPMKDTGFRCPSCEGRNVHISAGEEFFIEHIEVNLEEDREPSVEVKQP